MILIVAVLIHLVYYFLVMKSAGFISYKDSCLEYIFTICASVKCI